MNFGSLKIMFCKHGILIPGSYLYSTRYKGLVPIAGFVWLELLPFTLALYFFVGVEALFYLPLQYAFLGLYEIGYLFNDRAPTASESSRQVDVLDNETSGRLILSRSLFWLVAIVAVGSYAGMVAAQYYFLACITLLLLLLLHTWVGSRPSLWRRLRYITFSWLVLFKYLPAAIVLVGVKEALITLVIVFLYYGGGRIVAYFVEKESISTVPSPPINLLWFIAVGSPFLVVLSLLGWADHIAPPLYLLFSTYYVASGVNNYMRFRQISAHI